MIENKTNIEGLEYDGLKSSRVKVLLEKYGLNQIEKKAKASGLKIFFSQFSSPLILILLVAAGVTFFLGDFVDTYVILAAVVLNTILGFYQEYKAQRGLEALASMLSPRATVRRDGQRVSIIAWELVPGDLVYLNAGETIPADGVLVRAKQMMVNEALLTGESLLVSKKECKTSDNSGCLKYFLAAHERDDDLGKESVYMGTTISAGNGEMVIVNTGGRTEIGAIAYQLSQTIDEETPLQLRLKKLSAFLTITVLIVASLIFAIGMWSGNSFEEIFTLSVAVAVSAIPEGLAVSLTAILAIGMQRILKRKALVRKLLAAEVLGSVSVICSDKTGTLTEGEMKVTKVETVDEEKLILAACLGNNLYDPLEVGMWDWAKKQISNGKLSDYGKDSIADVVAKNPLVDQFPFDADLRYAVKLFEKGMYVVGAPEALLNLSDLNTKQKNEWFEKVLNLASNGLRVVGFGFKGYVGKKRLAKKDVSEMNFLGLIAYEDPVRKGVATALKKAKKAGVEVKVITGDYRETARGVMRQLGWEIKDEQIMEGEELMRMSDLELKRKVEDIVLFARTTPNQKLKIVEALQARGEVVAMTGDGVNDAPALKKSDIGIVVSTASDVSKETADVVLLDNNFSTIVGAIEEGRGIFENLRKVLLYLLSDSFTEVFLVLASVALSIPMPITAAQILWINLVDDGLPNLALTLDPKDSDLLTRKPRRRDEPIFDLEIKVLVALISIVTATLVFATFWWYLHNFGLLKARTMAFAMLGVDSLLYVFSSRSLRRPIWKDGFFKNPWLVGAALLGLVIQLVALYLPFFQRAFETVSLGMFDWMIIIVSSFVVLGVVEGVKWVFLHSHFDRKQVKYELALEGEVTL